MSIKIWNFSNLNDEYKINYFKNIFFYYSLFFNYGGVVFIYILTHNIYKFQLIQEL